MMQPQYFVIFVQIIKWSYLSFKRHMYISASIVYVLDFYIFLLELQNMNFVPSKVLHYFLAVCLLSFLLACEVRWRERAFYNNQNSEVATWQPNHVNKAYKGIQHKNTKITNLLQPAYIETSISPCGHARYSPVPCHRLIRGARAHLIQPHIPLTSARARLWFDLLLDFHREVIHDRKVRG
jgi:hypothetical protein